jgi:hypothetical protein
MLLLMLMLLLCTCAPSECTGGGSPHAGGVVANVNAAVVYLCSLVSIQEVAALMLVVLLLMLMLLLCTCAPW